MRGEGGAGEVGALDEVTEIEFPGHVAEVAPQPVRRSRPARLARRARAALTVPRLLLLLIAAVAAAGYAWSIDTAGLETFYAAGVRSMSESWHAFFYDAFDPRATITLDKLPGAFWIQALSVRCFGYSVWAMVLPQVLESTLTVFVLYRAVRRTAGTAAALTAAAILAASPVTLASTRGDLAEPLYLLCTVLAADATLRAITTGRRRSWYAAAVWVAVGFQAKMTEAWLVLPILALVLILATPAGRRRAALRAGLGIVLAVALSLVWMLCFTLTPASDRPYADGSKNNSIFAQVFDYNGTLRFGSVRANGFKPLEPPSPAAEEIALDNLENGSGIYPAAELTKPAWDRLLSGPLAPDCDWFMLLAIGGAAASFVARRRAGRGDPARAATVLWSAWLLGYGVAFSSATGIQGYYLATLIPAVAALAGPGMWALWRTARAGSRRAALALGALLAGQAAWAAWLLHATYAVPTAVIAATAVSAPAVAPALAVARDRKRQSPEADRVDPVDPAARRSVLTRRAAVLLAAVALFTGPLAAVTWLEVRAGGPFDAALASTGSIARPSATTVQARIRAQGAYGGSIHAEYTSGQWAQELSAGAQQQARQEAQGTEMLVFSSAEAAGYITYGTSDIVPVGGFTGNTPYPSVERIRQLIKSGKISVAVLPADDVVTANDPRVQAVEKLCTKYNGTFPTYSSYLVYDCYTGVSGSPFTS